MKVWPIGRYFDPRQIVLLRGKQPLMSTLQPRPVSLTQASTALQIYENTEVQVSVDTPRAGFLVLNDVWHPWWFGTVDGKPADIFQRKCVVPRHSRSRRANTLCASSSNPWKGR